MNSLCLLRTSDALTLFTLDSLSLARRSYWGVAAFFATAVGFFLAMGGFSPDELPASDSSDELAVARLHLPAHGHDRRAAELVPALVGAVVGPGVAVGTLECAFCLGVVDDEIGV